MNGKRAAANSIGILALACLAYCAFTYLYMQPRLGPATPGLAPGLRMMANFIVPALFIDGVYHIILLVRAFRTLEGRTRRLFPRSLFIVAVVLSGVFLLSDCTLLSDIGKEYARWDVSDQWLMLYGFTAFHIAVTVWGLLAGLTEKRKAPEARGEIGRDAFFLSMNQIGVLCGALGISACVLSLWGIVPDRFRAAWLMALAILSVFPLAVYLFYMVIRNRRKPLRSWFDEKQTADLGAGALVSVFSMMVVLVPAGVIEASVRTGLPAPFWPMTVFFVGLSALSTVSLARSRTAAEPE